MKGLFQCPPWARSFCPFRACGTYLRKFNLEAHLKKSFLRNVPLIVYKLQRQKYDSGLFQEDSVLYISHNLLLFLILLIHPKTGRMGRINDIDSNDASRNYPPTTIAMTCDITSFYQTFYQFLNSRSIDT